MGMRHIGTIVDLFVSCGVGREAGRKATVYFLSADMPATACSLESRPTTTLACNWLMRPLTSDRDAHLLISLGPFSSLHPTHGSLIAPMAIWSL